MKEHKINENDDNSELNKLKFVISKYNIILNEYQIKYGNEYINYKEKKLLYKYKRLSNVNNIREERRKILLEKLAEYKLECRNHGDCYSYIQFGYPDVDTVINNELEKYRNIFSKQKCEPNTSSIDKNMISF